MEPPHRSVAEPDVSRQRLSMDWLLSSELLDGAVAPCPVHSSCVPAGLRMAERLQRRGEQPDGTAVPDGSGRQGGRLFPDVTASSIAGSAHGRSDRLIQRSWMRRIARASADPARSGSGRPARAWHPGSFDEPAPQYLEELIQPPKSYVWPTARVELRSSTSANDPQWGPPQLADPSQRPCAIVDHQTWRRSSAAGVRPTPLRVSPRNARTQDQQLDRWRFLAVLHPCLLIPTRVPGSAASTGTWRR